MKSRPRDSGRNAQLERTIRILFELMRTGGGLSLEELAEKHGTTTRTIQRDLNALKSAGVPVDGEARDKRKYWRVDTRQETHKLSQLLDKGHFLAVCLAMGFGSGLHRNLGVFTALEDLQDKIADALRGGRSQLEGILNAFYFYDKYAYAQAAPDVLWSLVSAIESRTICKVTYRKPQRHARDKTFEIVPLKLFAHQGAAYLMCHVLKHDAFGTLNLQRIRALKPTARSGEVPRDFDPNSWEQSAFGVHAGNEETCYVLQFDAEVADYIRERIWHPSQDLRELPSGEVELRFTCGQSFEVTAWVASWRHWVRVIAPSSLRDELRELGETFVAQYGRR
jgi:predicted DNA-binding transcriptional regulator YafY